MKLPLFQFVKFDDAHGRAQSALRRRYATLEKKVLGSAIVALGALNDEAFLLSESKLEPIAKGRAIAAIERAKGLLTNASRLPALTELQEAYWWAGKEIWEDMIDVRDNAQPTDVAVHVDTDEPQGPVEVV